MFGVGFQPLACCFTPLAVGRYRLRKNQAVRGLRYHRGTAACFPSSDLKKSQNYGFVIFAVPGCFAVPERSFASCWFRVREDGLTTTLKYVRERFSAFVFLTEILVTGILVKNKAMLDQCGYNRPRDYVAFAKTVSIAIGYVRQSRFPRKKEGLWRLMLVF